jgi:hypothetical protein
MARSPSAATEVNVNYHHKLPSTQSARRSSPAEEVPAHVANAARRLDAVLRRRIEAASSPQELDRLVVTKFDVKKLLGTMPMSEVAAACDAMIQQLEAGEGLQV